MKLKSALPKEQKNGLEAIHTAAIKSPMTKHLIIAVVDAAEVKEYPDKEATFEILRIEAVPEIHQGAIAALLESIFEERTGSTRLDMGIEDDLDLRNLFRKKAKTPRTRREPDIFRQPEIEGGAKDEDVVDAEVVDDEESDTESPETDTETPESDTEEPETASDAPESDTDTPDAEPEEPTSE